MSFPLDDEYMKYDLDTSMYKLTIDGANNLLNIDLVTWAGNIDEANLVLDEVSESIYDYVSYYSYHSCYKYKVFLMAKDGELRTPLRRILVNQLRYFIRSGAGVIGDMHGVHIEKGKALGIMNIRGDISVSQSVERQLNRLGLLYAGKDFKFNSYSEDGTW